MDRDKFRSAVRLESAVSREERNAPDKADARYVAGITRKERLSVMQDWNRRWRGKSSRAKPPKEPLYVIPEPPPPQPKAPVEEEPSMYLPMTVTEVRNAYRGRGKEFEQYREDVSIKQKQPPRKPATMPPREDEAARLADAASWGGALDTGISLAEDGAGGAGAASSSSSSSAEGAAGDTVIRGLNFSALCCDEDYKSGLLERICKACSSGRKVRVEADPEQPSEDIRMALTKLYFLSLPYIRNDGYELRDDGGVRSIQLHPKIDGHGGGSLASF